jgi:hypothetical protein
MNISLIKKTVKTFLINVKLASAPPGVKCVRPSNPSCAHPSTCKKNGKCYYS